MQWKQVFAGFFAQSLFDGFDIIPKFDGLVVAYVEDSKRCATAVWIPTIATPRGARLSDIITSTQNSLNYVIDKGEISCVAAVVVYLNRTIFKNIFGEFLQSGI